MTPVGLEHYLIVSALLFALGLDGETILNTFYKQIPYKRQKDGWRVPFDGNRLKGYKAINDLVDADTGRVVVEAGQKITVRQARQLTDKGLKALRMSDEELIGHYIAEDLVNIRSRRLLGVAVQSQRFLVLEIKLAPHLPVGERAGRPHRGAYGRRADDACRAP